MKNRTIERIRKIGLDISDFEPKPIYNARSADEDIDAALCELAELISAHDDAICELAEMLAEGDGLNG